MDYPQLVKFILTCDLWFSPLWGQKVGHTLERKEGQRWEALMECWEKKALQLYVCLKLHKSDDISVKATAAVYFQDSRALSIGLAHWLMSIFC